MFLLDTNVVSELRKVASGKANEHVRRWIKQAERRSLHVSAITIEELEIGTLRMERRDAAQGMMLRRWLEEHVLPAFDPRPIRDAYIAATALAHGLTVVSRNTRDFSACGAPVLDPWQAPAR